MSELSTGDLIIITKKNQGIPVTGRVMIVTGDSGGEIRAAYLVDSSDVDPLYGKYTRKKTSLYLNPKLVRKI